MMTRFKINDIVRFKNKEIDYTLKVLRAENHTANNGLVIKSNYHGCKIGDKSDFDWNHPCFRLDKESRVINLLKEVDEI